MASHGLILYPPSTYDVYKKLKPHFHTHHDAACDEIRKATKGLGTDEAALVKILGPQSPDDRALIAHRYKDKYHQELKDLLKSETSGDFGFLLQLIARPLPDAEAFILHRAMAGFGTTESLIYPIVMGRTNEEIEILKQTYFAQYNKDLSVDLDGELGGDFKTVIMSALQAPVLEFKDSFHTRAKADEDADALYKAGEGKWGTDEKGFLKVLLASPPRYLKLLDEAYTKKHKHGIKAAIANEFSGYAKQALLYFLGVSLEPAEYLAEHIEGTMKGLGTDEAGLSAAIVRYHSRLAAISTEYECKYKLSLKTRIKGEISGDYLDLVIKVLEAPTTPPASY